MIFRNEILVTLLPYSKEAHDMLVSALKSNKELSIFGFTAFIVGVEPDESCGTITVTATTKPQST